MQNNYRIIDANLNRASEGIRVVEDIARFSYNNKEMASKLRSARHSLRKKTDHLKDELLSSRDSVKDIGRVISSSNNLDKKDHVSNIINANFKRAEEATRSIEEVLKLTDYNLSKEVEQIRFFIYTLEKEYNSMINTKFNKKKIPKGLYGITGEKFANGRSNIECVKEMIAGGIEVIQYREKEKPLRDKIEEIKQIREICRENNVLFIVNDHIDVALLVEADGIHVGQTDMHISDVRRLVGKDMIIGLSTHSPEQAIKAVEDGADYIGVGPIFPTTTKDTPSVGLEYLEFATKNIDIPFVAIGGIKVHNIENIKTRNPYSICLVSEIVGAPNIKDIVKKLNKTIKG